MKFDLSKTIEGGNLLVTGKVFKRNDFEQCYKRSFQKIKKNTSTTEIDIHITASYGR